MFKISLFNDFRNMMHSCKSKIAADMMILIFIECRYRRKAECKPSNASTKYKQQPQLIATELVNGHLIDGRGALGT